MRITQPDRWPRTADEARAIQDELRPLVVATDPEPPRFGTVAGLDSAYDDEAGVVAAAAVVLDADTLGTVESEVAHGTVEFPYVPGLLAFREVPTALRVLERLDTEPDLLVCDGQGLAHPRRFGLACHLGVLAGLPTIGVAKNAWGEYTAPGPERGDSSNLVLEGEVVGRALRTRAGVKPVFVSVGHLISLDTACAQVLALTPHYRQPETTRRADALCRSALRAALD
ncbi:endonuclease V [Nocardia puris]|uniref:Endonuclease V n=1 Tax=Nocardia puris TaxID=208602 RepID=A0A366DQT1_9NOCA|nr:endonuclease V [Nocardia puris]MBF6211046.1 endonuclease V [Nocardia puris]MBF6364642.1 endonuclease V [Nocardia puris]MBF6459571.1 endonuclease V [Nocardia puris]RBO92447.1 endonuclease V [Nocardia puris]